MLFLTFLSFAALFPYGSVVVRPLCASDCSRNNSWSGARQSQWSVEVHDCFLWNERLCHCGLYSRYVVVSLSFFFFLFSFFLLSACIVGNTSECNICVPGPLCAQSSLFITTKWITFCFVWIYLCAYDLFRFTFSSQLRRIFGFWRPFLVWWSA